MAVQLTEHIFLWFPAISCGYKHHMASKVPLATKRQTFRRWTRFTFGGLRPLGPLALGRSRRPIHPATARHAQGIRAKTFLQPLSRPPCPMVTQKKF